MIYLCNVFVFFVFLIGVNCLYFPSRQTSNPVYMPVTIGCNFATVPSVQACTESYFDVIDSGYVNPLSHFAPFKSPAVVYNDIDNLLELNVLNSNPPYLHPVQNKTYDIACPALFKSKEVYGYGEFEIVMSITDKHGEIMPFMDMQSRDPQPFMLEMYWMRPPAVYNMNGSVCMWDIVETYTGPLRQLVYEWPVRYDYSGDDFKRYRISYHPGSVSISASEESGQLIFKIEYDGTSVWLEYSNYINSQGRYENIVYRQNSDEWVSQSGGDPKPAIPIWPHFIKNHIRFGIHCLNNLPGSVEDVKIKIKSFRYVESGIGLVMLGIDLFFGICFLLIPIPFFIVIFFYMGGFSIETLGLHDLAEKRPKKPKKPKLNYNRQVGNERTNPVGNKGGQKLISHGDSGMPEFQYEVDISYEKRETNDKPSLGYGKKRSPPMVQSPNSFGNQRRQPPKNFNRSRSPNRGGNNMSPSNRRQPPPQNFNRSRSPDRSQPPQNFNRSRSPNKRGYQDTKFNRNRSPNRAYSPPPPPRNRNYH